MIILYTNSIQHFLRKWIFKLESNNLGEETWMALSILCLTGIMITTLLCSKYQKNKFSDFIFFGLNFIFILIAHIPNFATYLLHVNEAQHIAEAIALSKDLRFWISVDGTTIGPLPIYVASFISTFGFTIDYFTIRLLNVLIWLFILIFFIKIIRNYLSKELSYYLVAPLLATVMLFKNLDYVSYNGEILTVLIIIVSIWLIFRSIDKNYQNSTYNFFIGVTLVVIPFSKFQGGPLAVVLALSYILLIYKHPKSLIFLFIGFILPLVILITYLITFDAFYDFWQSYIINNLNYTKTGVGLKVQRGFFVNLIKFPFLLFKANETRVAFLLIISLTVIYLYKVFRNVKWQSIARLIFVDPKLFIFLIYITFSLLIVIIPGNMFIHYLIFLIPPVFMLLAIISNHFKEYIVSQNKSVFMALFVLLPGFSSIFEGNVEIRRINREMTENKTNDVVIYIKEHSEKGDRLALWGWEPNIFIETGLIMGTRESQSQRQILSENQSEYYISRYLNDLKRHNPLFFVDTTKKNDFHLDYDDHNFRNYPSIREYIDDHYLSKGEFEGVEIFVRK